MINGNWSKLMIMMLVLPGLMYTTCGKTPVTPNGYRSFSSLPPGQQTKEFGSYPISKQVDYFIFEFRYVHPFSNSLAFVIADRGDQAVPYMLNRIKSENDDRDKLAILYIFKIMFEHDHPTDPQGTLAALRDVVSKMKTPSVKQSADGMLGVIESHSAVSRN